MVEIETAKAAVELPIPWAGVVTELHVEPGQTVEVGTPILTIDVDPGGTSAPAPAAAAPAPAEEEEMKPLVGYGSKYFGGVNSAGILAGKKPLVEAAVSQGFIGFETQTNRKGIGRPLKLDRQEIVGVTVALQEWMSMDHEKRLARQEQRAPERARRRGRNVPLLLLRFFLRAKLRLRTDQDFLERHVERGRDVWSGSDRRRLRLQRRRWRS